MVLAEGEDKGYFAKIVAKAKTHAPAVIFVDEIEGLCQAKAQWLRKSFLEEMCGKAGSEEEVWLFAATSQPWDLDEAVRRRFIKRIMVPLPTAQEREEMFRLQLLPQSKMLKESDMPEFAGMTEGATGSQISALIKECLMEPIRKCTDARLYRQCPDGWYEPAAEKDPEGRPLPDPTKLRATQLTKV